MFDRRLPESRQVLGALHEVASGRAMARSMARQPCSPRAAPRHASGPLCACIALKELVGMCGRFTQKFTWREIRELYELVGDARNLQAHYNIAPTDTVEVVRPSVGGTAELMPMHWGLIPYWWKKPLKQAPATFNARAETVATTPMFRDAFKRHRCIVPASGYYEWLKRPDGKQPYFISTADGKVLSLAGLWDQWRNPETKEMMTSCTIIVTDANALTRTVHNRMPVVLDDADVRSWLNGTAGGEVLKPAAEDRLQMWPVSRRVNKTGNSDDDATLIDEVAV
jgi:putative SOS response-associated peptidase YedK